MLRLGAFAMVVVWLASCVSQQDPHGGANATSGQAPEVPPNGSGVPGRWTETRASTPSSAGIVQHEVALAADGAGHIYAYWIREREGGVPGAGTLGLAVSGDGGRTWQQRTAPRARPTDDWFADPALAVSPRGRLHAVWLETTTANWMTDLFYAFSDDHGSTFSTPRQINPPGDRRGVDRPWVAACGEHGVVIVWTRGVADVVDTVVVSRSPDGLSSWVDTVVRQVSDGQSCSAPSLAVRGSRIAVGWNEALTDGAVHYRVATSESSGPFSAPREVEPFYEPARWTGVTMPRIALGPKDEIYVVYSTVAGVHVARSTAGGAFAETLVAAGTPEARLWLAAIAVTDDRVVHVAWMNGPKDRWRPMYARSTDGARTFSHPEAVSSHTFAYSVDPATAELADWHRMGDFNDLTATATSIHYGWADNRAGHFEIYVASCSRKGNAGR